MTLPRFYPILDTAALAARGLEVVAAAEAVLGAGARIIQLRHKGFFSRDVFGRAERIAALCRAEGVDFVINDRADVARLLGAGLHLGQQDLTPTEARPIVGSDAVVGFSTHNAAQLAIASTEPADYLVLGPIFGTTSKDKPDPVVGLANLRAWRGLSSLPLAAIGGITRATAGDVLAAGADSLAVIGDLLADPPSLGRLRDRAQEWLEIVSSYNGDSWAKPRH